jgi:hypothetical protein
MQPLTIQQIIDSNKPLEQTPILRTPAYCPEPEMAGRAVLGVASMQHHMTDEGWQITAGLAKAGYTHCGYGLPCGMTDCHFIVRDVKPGIVVMQDKREWFPQGDFREPKAQFRNLDAFRNNKAILRLTVLKDAQQRPQWHREAAEELGVHGWIVYYNPRIVNHLAPYTRAGHLIRTWHTVDADKVPDYSDKGRQGCLFSGAISNAYPERQHLLAHRGLAASVLPHPGYHRKGCNTPGFMQHLSRFKISICTCSRYGYALRKIVESTACGCAVLTDLPIDEYIPGIDENLTRVNFREMSLMEIDEVILGMEAKYSPERQKFFADRATLLYDYRQVTSKLAYDIEMFRRNFNHSPEYVVDHI